MKSLGKLTFIVFVSLATFLLNADSAYAVCGIREQSGQCIRNSEPISGAITCTGTSTICCSPASDCPQPPQPGPGEVGGPCITGVAGIQCNEGNRCVNDVCTPDTGPPVNTAEEVQCDDRPGTVSTAIGCVDFNDINQTGRFFLGWGLGIAGGVALLLISLAGFRIATSQGNPQRLQGGQELLLSAIGGLLMIILSVYLLRFIGVDLLGIF
ncbi:hypothetical protein A2803_01465 [Candidatus Woesebacteria bacterium RIFCSPHIGHO2_01_FULL_44_21]|uniref:Uncharacterized protein n=1 Tax=Candidatus Woesebacteria bacterium RIFCSPHIGHO2_01_FULL_44_21 TaxID=1802503 RepID=A0A1F7YZT7_9BACT|nr:MAG: hypothetical protein A2803_01465 [Candidatus Woesebacteria bacterium RIFCSPHIGHO2_01_FULL_44_21]